MEKTVAPQRMTLSVEIVVVPRTSTPSTKVPWRLPRSVHRMASEETESTAWSRDRLGSVRRMERLPRPR